MKKKSRFIAGGELKDPSGTRRALLSDAHETLSKIREVSFSGVTNPVENLLEIRKIAYESLNQIPHAILILDAIEWLKKHKGITATNWHWHPHQTRKKNEPDLSLTVDGTRIVSAEATTSENPVGKIDERMSATLKDLNNLRDMGGDLFYFVRTPKMAERARIKILKYGMKIEVVDLSATD